MINDLPTIDVVTISHNHYDHLDIRSLKKISEKFPEVIFLIPEGDLDILKKEKLLMLMNLIGGKKYL